MKGQLSFMDMERKTVLMSLREEYYQQILNGTKKYEYRTRYLKEESNAYIYISKTRKSIVAKINFGEPIIGDAKTIALIAEEEQTGSFNDMIAYFYKNIGYAIPIESVTIIDDIDLIQLKKDFPNFVVPQSYYILDKKPELLSYLDERTKGKECIKRK